MSKTAITPTRSENYPTWYQEVIKAPDLAENSPVRGCMVIKPWGYGIWENIQKGLDAKFKATGHENAYFPLLIPLSFLEKEADHVEGFAKECAVVTHHRLIEKDGRLIPDGELEEPLVIRPTSETIIGNAFAKWTKSYRDLPILINQWCNVMRWEMRTRMFLRTSEFLWQEGHTVHATSVEAVEETLKMLDIYEDFAENYMAMPVIKGEKTPDERFPGAVNTYAIESLMQDNKALQAGTSHFLGQNFSKASEIKFDNANKEEEYAWTTSWGVSTRLIGGLIMTHGDDNGIIVPPRLAPQQIVIIPIYRKEEERASVLEYVNKLAQALRYQKFGDEPIRVKIDDRDIRGGEKSWQHIKKGVPLKVEIGPRDMAKDSVFAARRDFDPKEKFSMASDEFIQKAPEILSEIQNNLFEKAKKRQDENSAEINDLDEFKKFFKGRGGFAISNWCEKAIGHPLLDQLKVTPRCIPLGAQREVSPTDKCIFSGKQATHKVIFAKAY